MIWLLKTRDHWIKNLGDEKQTRIQLQEITGKRLREICTHISTLSYIIQDNEILQTARADLEKDACFMSEIGIVTVPLEFTVTSS